MKKIIIFILFYLFRAILWLRYRITVKGLENLKPTILNKPGGVLFLPNHPTVFLDPVLVTLMIWKKYPIRPLVVEYMYYLPIVYWVMQLMHALPVPNFITSSNSLKKKKADQVIQTVIEDLKKRANFLIYPAGRIKNQAQEIIGATSAVHRIIQTVPEANIVLVKTSGLWGSSFSRALTGTTPSMFEAVLHGIKIIFKNLIFFTPRRNVTIEFVPVGPDFPYQASRMELNRYLENWYNRPDHLPAQGGDQSGESLYLVSYSMWKEELPIIKRTSSSDAKADISQIPMDIQQKVKAKLSEISRVPSDEIHPGMQLASDLGLDSLDNADLIAFLDDHYDVSGVPVSELTTVGRLMALAAKQVVLDEIIEKEQVNFSKWNQQRGPKERLSVSAGETIPEVFLNNCSRFGKMVACADAHAGILNYAQVKTRVLLLADYIRHLPGEYIGILLPASVAAYLTIIASQLAGKVPIMINWTVGPRHLESVMAAAKPQVVLSSWAFLDQLENTDLNGVEDFIETLEDIRRKLSWLDKIRAFYRSKLYRTSSLLSLFGIQTKTKNSLAVLLFTSGTENMPKGVPLTHENILSNERAAVKSAEIYTDDTLLAMLPPFHAFGFTVSGLLPLLTGLKVIYSPDPTNGRGLAAAIKRWAATIVCGAPTFLKGIFKNAQSDQLKTLRLCITGAEKTPPELFDMVRHLGHCSLIEGYGITECSPVLTINIAGDPSKGVGIPLEGIELGTVDLATHQPITKGQQGLVIARGPNIFSGYLNKEIASPFLFINGQPWYVTGDLGYLDGDGNLILSGRLKRFIKVGGEMVSLAAIEDALQQTIGSIAGRLIEEGPILAICAKEEAGERPKIFLFTRFSITIEEANKALKEAGFSNLVRIYQVQQLAEIPLMGTGKINYRALEAILNETKVEYSKAIS